MPICVKRLFNGRLNFAGSTAIFLFLTKHFKNYKPWPKTQPQNHQNRLAHTSIQTNQL